MKRSWCNCSTTPAFWIRYSLTCKVDSIVKVLRPRFCFGKAMQVGTRNSVSYSAALVHVKVSILHTVNISLTTITVTVLRYNQQERQCTHAVVPSAFVYWLHIAVSPNRLIRLYTTSWRFKVAGSNKTYLDLYANCSIWTKLGFFGRLFVEVHNTKYVVLDNDGEHQLDRSCEKWRSIRQSQGGERCTCNKWRKANWIGHILRGYCLLKCIIQVRTGGKAAKMGKRM
jgi:hypothetical protein